MWRYKVSKERRTGIPNSGGGKVLTALLLFNVWRPAICLVEEVSWLYYPSSTKLTGTKYPATSDNPAKALAWRYNQQCNPGEGQRSTGWTQLLLQDEFFVKYHDTETEIRSGKSWAKTPASNEWKGYLKDGFTSTTASNGPCQTINVVPKDASQLF